MAQKVVFSFDEGSLDSLRNVKENGSFSSMGTAVRDSIQISEVLQDLVSKGFTEVILRNPKTDQEKSVIIPSLQKIAKNAESK